MFKRLVNAERSPWTDEPITLLKREFDKVCTPERLRESEEGALDMLTMPPVWFRKKYKLGEFAEPGPSPLVRAANIKIEFKP